MDDKNNLKEIIKYRIEKLNNLRHNGYDPFPYNYNKSDNIDSINNNCIDKMISIAGRIVSFRKMGKASFAHIQDETGKIQLYLKHDILPDKIYDQIVKNLDLGDIIGCSGVVFITKMGEISIKANEIKILSKNIRPLPNLKEKEGEAFNSFDDKEMRYRNRHLDMIANPKVIKIFRDRATIISLIRKYLDNSGYLEVETPILQPVYGGASARPFETFYNTLDQKYFLRIADELYLKKLIIGGCEKVYELAKNFRNEGMDRSHNPEYTSLEFYQAYSDLNDMMIFTENLVRYIATNMKKEIVSFKGHKININKKFNKDSMFNLIKKYTNEDLSYYNKDELFKYAKDKIDDIDDTLNYGQLIDKIFGDFVEPNLITPIFVTDYPKAISPLAKHSRTGNKEIVERFELFISGMEFANSFSELNDPIEQRKRLEEQMKFRDLGDFEAQILDESFIEAMEVGMPPTGGVGIGIDRLIMLLTEQSSIKDVILFPAMRT